MPTRLTVLDKFLPGKFGKRGEIVPTNLRVVLKKISNVNHRRITQ
jgi:hypothetical protein